MSDTEILSPFEAGKLHVIAYELAINPKYAAGDRDCFDEAGKIFDDEIRARYDAADHGNFDAYREACDEIFEFEWNEYHNAPDADAA